MRRAGRVLLLAVARLAGFGCALRAVDRRRDISERVDGSAIGLRCSLSRVSLPSGGSRARREGAPSGLLGANSP